MIRMCCKDPGRSGLKVGPGIFMAWAVWVIVLFSWGVCVADESKNMPAACLTQLEHGSINWATGHVYAVGRASPKDNTDLSHESVPGAARADANRHLIQILKQINISDTLSVGEYASKNDAILAGIEKAARDSIVEKQYYNSALSVEITIKTSMLGGFLQLILPEQIRQIPQISTQVTGKVKTERESHPHTGLVIDARKLEVLPVLNPVIASEKGDDIFSAEFISREFAVQNGVCRYFCSMEKALKDEKTGPNPVVFKALRKEGEQNNAIILSMSDYRQFEKIEERHAFLKECRLIIVIDQ